MADSRTRGSPSVVTPNSPGREGVPRISLQGALPGRLASANLPRFTTPPAIRPFKAAAVASTALTLGFRWRAEVSNPRHDLSKFGGAATPRGWSNLGVEPNGQNHFGP